MKQFWNYARRRNPSADTRTWLIYGHVLIECYKGPSINFKIYKELSYRYARIFLNIIRVLKQLGRKAVTRQINNQLFVSIAGLKSIGI